MKKKFKPKKEPSLLRKVIQVYWERHKEKQAERIIERQVWSLEYLARAIDLAASMGDRGIVLTIKDKDGRCISIESKDVMRASDGGILDRIDDDVAVRDFISRHSVR